MLFSRGYLPIPWPRPRGESLPEVLNPHALPLVEDWSVGVDDVAARVGLGIVASASRARNDQTAATPQFWRVGRYVSESAERKVLIYCT